MSTEVKKEIQLEIGHVPKWLESLRRAGRRTCFSPQDQALNYAQNRASFRSGEIRLLDSTGALERTIQFTEANRKL